MTTEDKTLVRKFNNGSREALQRAYLRGGIEAVDRQSQQAFDELGSTSVSVSMRELLNASNGV